MLNYQEIKNNLDSVGKGFCIAKWTQVTIHLQTGHNHSCHHPGTHKINVSEINRNPSALHNTQFKKEKRKEMLNGLRPSECDYCWNVEDNSNLNSDRTLKSSEPWSWPHFETIKNSDWREDFNPRYVEVAFSNACNFKCSYCAPVFSSKWMQEIEQFGGYPTASKFNDLSHFVNDERTLIKHNEYNPYTEAFWKWWPELYRDLDTFRITGGEPLLAKDTWKILDYIIEEKNPNKNLKLAINSNLGVPDELIDKLIEKIKIIENEEKVKELVIFTSCDAWGEQAEYIRNGLEFNRFWDNVNKVLANSRKLTLVFMVTYNALSVFSFDKLIKGILDLKRVHFSEDRIWQQAAIFDTSYLRNPRHQTVQILPYDFKKNILEQSEYAYWLSMPYYSQKYIGCSDIEIQKIKRTYDWAISDIDPANLMSAQRDFYKFFSEHDRRRGTNFIKTFPELEEFYNFCKTM